jgi:hypothetical protein
MMCGVVPVVTHLQGITDALVQDGQSGFLIPVDRIDGFADRVVHLFQNVPALVRMREAASSRAASLFTQERMLDEYEAMYSEKDDRMLRQPASRFAACWEICGEMLCNRAHCGSVATRLRRLAAYLLPLPPATQTLNAK